jgi:predicted nucleic acid-binding protein
LYLDTSVLGALYIPEAFSAAADGAPLSTLDALHLAIAVSNREPLCTADRQLARAAAHLGAKVHLIRI